MAMNDETLVALVDEALLTLEDLCRAGAVAPRLGDRAGAGRLAGGAAR